MSNFWALVILALGSYLFGNINWALIISKIKKTDIRKLGSGNPGTLNMSRNLGLKAGLLTFFLDIMKGVIPTLTAFFVLRGRCFDNSSFVVSDFAIYLCGLCAVRCSSIGAQRYTNSFFKHFRKTCNSASKLEITCCIM